MLESQKLANSNYLKLTIKVTLYLTEDFFGFLGPEVEHLKDGINCRPGRLGILSEALYCKSEEELLGSKSSTTTEIPSEINPPPNVPSLIQILLDNVPRFPSNPFNIQDDLFQ